jgi:uncharacterized protein (TIGR00725 family)
MKKLQIAIIGSAGPEEYPFAKPLTTMFKEAERVGQLLAQAGCIVVNGGKGGVMLAVSQGAKRAGGITVAEISGLDRLAGNDYIDVEIVTGDLAFRGPSQIMAMSDAVIALGGGGGTLQEICVAYRLAKPIILLKGFGGWTDRLCGEKWLDERQIVQFNVAASAEEAVKKTLSLVQSKQGKS